MSSHLVLLSVVEGCSFFDLRIVITPLVSSNHLVLFSVFFVEFECSDLLIFYLFIALCFTVCFVYLDCDFYTVSSSDNFMFGL